MKKLTTVELRIIRRELKSLMNIIRDLADLGTSDQRLLTIYEMERRYSNRSPQVTEEQFQEDVKFLDSFYKIE